MKGSSPSATPMCTTLALVSDQDSPDVLASDAERDAVVSKLNQAVGEGRLTMNEFSERLDLAATARTRGDLAPLLRDLPDSSEALAATTGTTPATTRGAGTRWHISPIGGISQRGHWRVPERTLAISVLGGMDIDLGEAELAAREVEVTKISIIGGVAARVPPGMRVEVSNFSILGGRDIKLEAPQAPDAPVLHIRSFSVIGGVRVRESGRNMRRRDRDYRDGQF
jgi:Domain of unknown function (DUF1707)